MNELAAKYPQEIERIFAKYPPEGRRSAVMPLLYLAQREMGYVNRQALAEIAELCGISATDVASIVGYYTLYHENPGGKIRIQVCNDLPCALRGADDFLKQLCAALNIQPGETTPDGLVTVEAVMCLAACDKAPMFQVQTGSGLEYHEKQTVESAMALVGQLKEQQAASPVAGPEAEGDVDKTAKDGVTSLTREERIKVMQEGGQ